MKGKGLDSDGLRGKPPGWRAWGEGVRCDAFASPARVLLGRRAQELLHGPRADEPTQSGDDGDANDSGRRHHSQGEGAAAREGAALGGRAHEMLDALCEQRRLAAGHRGGRQHRARHAARVHVKCGHGVIVIRSSIHTHTHSGR